MTAVAFTLLFPHNDTSPVTHTATPVPIHGLLLPAEPPEPGNTEERPDPRRRRQPAAEARADALALLSSSFLGTAVVPTSNAETYRVVIHVDAGGLVDDGVGRCHPEEGPALSIEVVRRLTRCGALPGVTRLR